MFWKLFPINPKFKSDSILNLFHKIKTRIIIYLNINIFSVLFKTQYLILQQIIKF
jgi:hypothetical protein